MEREEREGRPFVFREEHVTSRKEVLATLISICGKRGKEKEGRGKGRALTRRLILRRWLGRGGELNSYRAA